MPNEFGVQPASFRIFLHDLVAAFVGHGRTIRPVAGQCVVHICHGQDSYEVRYRVACQTVRVTRAVDSFVMPADERKDIACRAKRFDDSRAIGRMPLDYVELLRRQRTRFVEGLRPAC